MWISIFQEILILLSIFFNTTADLSSLPQDVKNMLEYINSGTTNDPATTSLDEEVKEARLKEEWRADYMLTLVHDMDVFREGYESRQEEIDTLTTELANKDTELANKEAELATAEAELARIQALLISNGIDPLSLVSK